VCISYLCNRSCLYSYVQLHSSWSDRLSNASEWLKIIKIIIVIFFRPFLLLFQTHAFSSACCSWTPWIHVFPLQWKIYFNFHISNRWNCNYARFKSFGFWIDGKNWLWKEYLEYNMLLASSWMWFSFVLPLSFTRGSCQHPETGSKIDFGPQCDC